MRCASMPSHMYIFRFSKRICSVVPARIRTHLYRPLRATDSLLSFYIIFPSSTLCLSDPYYGSKLNQYMTMRQLLWLWLTAVLLTTLALAEESSSSSNPAVATAATVDADSRDETNEGSCDSLAPPAHEIVPDEQLQQQSCNTNASESSAPNDETSSETEDDVTIYWQFEDWGKPQYSDDTNRDKVMAVVGFTKHYMQQEFYATNQHPQKHRCRNDHNDCSLWVIEGACRKDDEHDYMLEHCAPACRMCEEYMETFYGTESDSDEEEEDDEDQPPASDSQRNSAGPPVPTAWGLPQRMDVAIPDKVFWNILEETHEYMTETVMGHLEEYAAVFRNCENRHADCTYWKAMNQCETNPDYMHIWCAPTCQTCEMLDIRNRCPIDPDEPQVFSKPGDLNAMFERIISDPYWVDTYGPLEIVSSPATTGGPWIITLEHFVNDEECQRFIDYAQEAGFELSEDVGDEDEFGFDGTMQSVESEERTSTNAWCFTDCYEDPVTRAVHDRIEKLTGTHYNNSEYYQILRYEPGQFYGEHHDYIESEYGRPQGPRILTVFMYLSDVEEGGGTHFGMIDKTIMPKKGKVVVWPSVLDEDPLEMDEQTNHQALPVIQGLKYGANAWIHLRNFKYHMETGCAGVPS